MRDLALWIPGLAINVASRGASPPASPGWPGSALHEGRRSRPSVPVGEDPTVRNARNAVYAVFFSAGFIFASWASRIPQVRAELGVGPGVLGLVLLSAAVGSALGTTLSGLLIGWIGEIRTVISMCWTAAAGMLVVAAGCRLRLAGHPRGGGRAVPLRPRQRGLGRGHERARRGGGARAWPGHPAQVPRRVEHRHRGRGRCRGGHGRVSGAGHGAPDRGHTGGRRGRADRRPPVPALQPHHRARGRRDFAAPGAGRVDRSADPAHRPVRALHGVHRGNRERLAQPRGHRRLPRAGRPGHPGVRLVPGRDDGRTLVRPPAHRPLRPGPRAAGLRRHRPGRPAS